jgi:hypothetical protein
MNARFLGALALSATIAGFTPHAAFADTFVNGTFAVAFSTTPNTGALSYCGGPALPRAIEAHGSGSTWAGPLSFALFKTGGGGAFHGCLTLTAPNGDVLEATYVGTALAPNSNNFSFAAGTLTFTGGTGRFKNASGEGTWTGVFDTFYVASSVLGGGPAVPAQGMAFYEIQGRVRRGH